MAERIDRRDAGTVLEMMQATGAFRDAGRWNQLLEVYRLCGRIDQVYTETLDSARDAAGQVSAASLDAPGLDGPALGQAIADRRRQMIEQVLLQAQQ
jgi:hypothetical protein